MILYSGLLFGTTSKSNRKRCTRTEQIAQMQPNNVHNSCNHVVMTTLQMKNVTLKLPPGHFRTISFPILSPDRVVIWLFIMYTLHTDWQRAPTHMESRSCAAGDVQLG